VDFTLYGRVLRRHRTIVVVGFAAAVVLATAAYYRISFSGGLPKLTPRSAQLWQSQADVFLTEGGFPAGRRNYPVITQTIGGDTVTIPKFNNPFTYAGLAPLYARLATSDVVGMRVRKLGPPYGSINAAPAVDNSSGNSVMLPMVWIFGRADSAAAAQLTTARALDAFLGYVREQQQSGGIPASQRIQLQVVNAPEPATLLLGRKKTLPIVVFFGVLTAAIALVFVRENRVRSRPAIEVVSDPESSEMETAAIRTPVAQAEPEPEPEPEPEVSSIRRWA
jgi:hypothetical protein